MFETKGVRKITPDEKTFALCFARTMSVRQSCAAAGFEPRTSFARASRLLERDDVRSLVRTSILDASFGSFPAESADPAPVGSVDGAANADIAPVSLENVRDAHTAGIDERVTPCLEDGFAPSGEKSTFTRDGYEQSVTHRPTECVPAPNAAKDDDDAPPSGREESASSFTSPLEREERRIMREYEKIAFADASKDSDVKIADKLRALEQYRAIVEKQTRRLADLAEAERLANAANDSALTVIYDYGDGA